MRESSLSSIVAESVAWAADGDFFSWKMLFLILLPLDCLSAREEEEDVGNNLSF